MIRLEKKTKLKMLKSIKSGYFDGNDFEELQTELHKINIELIDHSSQVDQDNIKLQSDENRNN